MTPQEKLAQQIQWLEQLAALDAEIRKLDGEIETEQSALDGLRKDLLAIDERLSQKKSSVDEMVKAIGEAHTEARQMAAQIDRSREKLGRARNERESVAAEREMDELRKLLRDREEESNKLTLIVDAAKKEIADLEAQRGKLHGELSSTESGTSQKIVDVRAERERKLAARAEIAKKIPPQTFRRYETVRQKRGTGLAPVTEGTCRACHMQLPPQLFQKLMRREVLEECPSCKRILYWSNKPAAEGEEEEKA